MSALTSRLRALYKSKTSDDDNDNDDNSSNAPSEDAEFSAEGNSKKRTKKSMLKSNKIKVTADLDSLDAADANGKDASGSKGKRRLRLRQDIPMLMPGKKVNRKDLVNMGGDSGDNDLNEKESDSETQNSQSADDMRSDGSDDDMDEDDDDEEGESESELEEEEEENSESDSESQCAGSKSDSDSEETKGPKSKSKSSKSLALSKSLEKEYQKAFDQEKMQKVQDAKRRKIGLDSTDSTMSKVNNTGTNKFNCNQNQNLLTKRSQQVKSENVKQQLKILRQLETFRIHLEPAMKVAAKKDETDTESTIDYDKMTSAADETLKMLINLQKSIAPSGYREVAKEQNMTLQNSNISSTLNDSHIDMITKPISFSTSYFTEVADSISRSLDPNSAINSAKNSFKVLDQSIKSQTELAFKDGESWKNKVHPKISNTNDNKVLDTSVYDDHEFYLQMLQDIVSNGAFDNEDNDDKDNDATTSLSDLRKIQSKRALSKLSNSRLSTDNNNSSTKNHDYERRASKGRKIRYVPIEKLENFMAAESRDYDEEYPEDAVNALMGSLFRS